MESNIKTTLKAILEFDLNDCEAKIEFDMIFSANKVYQVLYRLREEVFRPARKHGYSDDDINLLLENCGGHDSLEIGQETKFVSKDVLEKNPDKYYSNGEALISLLEKKYSQILEEENIDEDLYL